ncbi:hypothetical protein RSOLAG22IIIB_03562 [Rhizoctonia solani]|uniref:Uncharacterized protein n=1 Tax=Rhizoctonia solani TaxID=456999 RepID=A0A0K6FRB8_9AGAM|nr:hypothetical protein RSOLAG22IIIB_03562 [Rhizoctonia solani]
MSKLSKKLFALTLMCLAIVFYSSLYPSTALIGHLPSGGGLKPSPTVPLPGSPVSVSVPAPASHPDPPTQSGARIILFVQELTGVASRVGRSLTTEADHVKVQLFSFFARSYLHSRILPSAPPPTRTTPVFIPPSRTVSQKNPALPTPGHTPRKTPETGFIQVDELVYSRPLTKGLPRDDTPKAHLGLQYFVFLSAYYTENSSWLVSGAFAMLVGAIVVLEAWTQLGSSRPTLEAQSCTPASTTLDPQVADTNAPGSIQIPTRYIKSDFVIAVGIQLVASLTLATSDQEVLVCTSSNVLVCSPSSIDLWLDAIIARDLPILGELCTNIGTVATIHSSIHIATRTLEADVLDAWGIDDRQDYLFSHWSILVHSAADHIPYPSCIPAGSCVGPQYQANRPAVARAPVRAPIRSIQIHSSWTDWRILGLIMRHFSTSLRLSATCVERGGCLSNSSHTILEHFARVRELSPGYRPVSLLVKVIVIPDSTFTLLLFGRHSPAECTGDSPLRRGLLIGWAPYVDPPTRAINIPDPNPVSVERRAQKPIRPGYGVYRPPSAQAASTSEGRLERTRARQQVLEQVEQDEPVTEARTCPDQDVGAEGARRRTRRGGRRAKERRERQLARD